MTNLTSGFGAQTPFSHPESNQTKMLILLVSEESSAQEATKDLEVKGSKKSQQRSVTDYPALSDCTQNTVKQVFCESSYP